MVLQLQRLPNELIRDALEYCLTGTTNELATLCLVSTAVRAWANPALFRTVCLVSRRQFDSFVLACSPTRSGDYTHCLSIALTGGASEALAPGELDGLLQRLPNLINLRLESSDMRHVTHCYSASHLCVVGTIHQSRWCRSAVAPHITHLFIEDPYCVNALKTRHAQSLFPALTHAGFAARPFGSGLLMRFVQDWLAIPTLQRVCIIIIYHNAVESAEMLPEILPALESIQDARAYVLPTDSLAILDAIGVEHKSSIRRSRLAGATLGIDALRGLRDVWSLGSSLLPAQ